MFKSWNFNFYVFFLASCILTFFTTGAHLVTVSPLVNFKFITIVHILRTNDLHKLLTYYRQYGGRPDSHDQWFRVRLQYNRHRV